MTYMLTLVRLQSRHAIITLVFPDVPHLQDSLLERDWTEPRDRAVAQGRGSTAPTD